MKTAPETERLAATDPVCVAMRADALAADRAHYARLAGGTRRAKALAYGVRQSAAPAAEPDADFDPADLTCAF